MSRIVKNMIRNMYGRILLNVQCVQIYGIDVVRLGWIMAVGIVVPFVRSSNDPLVVASPEAFYFFAERGGGRTRKPWR